MQETSTNKPSRRDVVKTAAAVGAAAATAVEFGKAPAVVKAAGSDVVNFAVIGSGGRGSYLLKHLNKVENGRCIAVCDVKDEASRKGIDTYKLNKAVAYKDYREVMNNKDVQAVIIAVPLYLHYEVTKAALEAGKHTFCEKSLVFKPEEVHALRALYKNYPKQVLQVGLQRRYSKFYQTARQMIEKGLIGDVTHIHAQWHRNPGWTMKQPPGPQNPANWRLFKDYSGGLTAELASHQIDVADWMFGSQPEYVIGVGGIDYWKDGRTVYDNIQLIYKYPKGQKLVYSSITTNSHLPYLNATRPEFGEVIMGTKGAIHLTIGDGEIAMPTGMWFQEPRKAEVAPAGAGKEKAAAAGASYALGAGSKGLPLLMDKDKVTDNDSFLSKEMKYARQWLLQKGVMVSEEDRNPVDVELESFFNDCKTGGHPKADMEIGLADSVAVILSNLAMEQERRVYFSEIDKMGTSGTPAKKA
ncbi:dehydrogenase [Bryobacterales bacterium F-183]|nr:dehydrogenase [Bryobacterales bacterium F-183]